MASSTLEDCIDLTALLQAQTQTELNIQPIAFHRFMELPIEIRLLVYDKLMVHNVNLCRAKCPSCPERGRYYRYLDSTIWARVNLPCLQLLMASKQIYGEILPVLYSKNTIYLKCQGCEEDYDSRVWACRVDPLDKIPDTIEHYCRRVRDIFVDYKTNYYQPYLRIRQVSAKWPTTEAQILACYENIERVSLRTERYGSYTTFDLVRRSCKSKTHRAYDYKSLLAQCVAQKPPMTDNESAYIEVQTALTALETTSHCHRFIESEAQCSSKDTVFAVRAIRWKSEKVDSKEHVWNLECDKRSAETEQTCAEQKQRE